jgi:hypothetical protein
MLASIRVGVVGQLSHVPMSVRLRTRLVTNTCFAAMRLRRASSIGASEKTSAKPSAPASTASRAPRTESVCTTAIFPWACAAATRATSVSREIDPKGRPWFRLVHDLEVVGAFGDAGAHEVTASAGEEIVGFGPYSVPWPPGFVATLLADQRSASRVRSSDARCGRSLPRM